MKKSLTQSIKDILEENELDILVEMSNIKTDEKCGMTIIVNKARTRTGVPYFKVVNNTTFLSSDKIARISFLDAKYVRHANRKGQSDWKLNNQEKKQLSALLKRDDNKLKFDDGKKYSVWQHVIAQYNKEQNGLFEYSDTEKVLKKNYASKKEMETNPLPIDLDMPDYTKL